MKLEYRFKNVPALKNLGVLVENQGAKIKTRVSGTRNPWWWFVIKRYFAFYNALGTLGRHKDSNVYSLYVPPFPSSAHARMLEAFLAALFFKKRMPVAVTIGVTNACQYRCFHCSSAGRPKNRPILSFEELRRTIQECLDLGISNITFTGGEPLLREDLEHCIASVPPDMALAQVFTNGLGLSHERAHSLKAAGAFAVQISLDSSVPAEHDALRGYNGAFEAVKTGVQNALDAGLLVGISTYANKERAFNHGLLPLADLCADWGVHEISVFDAIETGRLRGKKEVTLDQAARKILLSDSRSVNKKYGGRPRMITQTWTNTGKGFSRFIGCLAANWQFHITAQGDFTPCDFTPLSFGNIREKSVKDLWEVLLAHPEYRNWRQTCRMQDPAFRKKYIDVIPAGADLPFPIDA